MRETEKLKNEFNLSKIEENARELKSLKEVINNIFLRVYPIGSIYLTLENKNPKDLFGGEWAPISNKFLMGAGEGFEALKEGGAFFHSHETLEHKLILDEIPSHSHSTTVKLKMASGSNTGELNTQQLGIGKTGTVYNNANPVTVTNGSSGGSKAHSHGDTKEADSLPPYICVYIWKRIS